MPKHEDYDGGDDRLGDDDGRAQGCHQGRFGHQRARVDE
jgi:hypothetical protein